MADAGYTEEDCIELVNAMLVELSNTETGKSVVDEFRAIDAEQGISINFGSFVNDLLGSGGTVIGKTMYLQSDVLTEGADFSTKDAVSNMLLFAHESVHVIQNGKRTGRFFTLMAEAEAYLIEGIIYDEYQNYSGNSMPGMPKGSKYMKEQVFDDGRDWYDGDVILGLQKKYQNDDGSGMYNGYRLYSWDFSNDFVIDLDLQ